MSAVAKIISSLKDLISEGLCQGPNGLLVILTACIYALCLVLRFSAITSMGPPVSLYGKYIRKKEVLGGDLSVSYTRQGKINLVIAICITIDRLVISN